MQKRLKELHDLLESQDLNRLSRRLLDLCADFELDDSLLNEAHEIRSEALAIALLTDKERAQARLHPALDRARNWVAQLAATAPATQSPTPIVVADLQGVGKTFVRGSFSFSLKPISLKLTTGEITGIVGENGNGKTTLLRIMAGELARDQGQIRYPAFSADPDDWYHIRHQIGYIAQHSTPWHGQLRDNLAFTAAIHGIRGSANNRAVDFILQRLGLTQYATAAWNEISGGYKLRFELARALVWRPMLLVIDEPMAHLDINTQQMFLQDLRYLTDSLRFPMATVISSQHLHEVERIADRIIFIRNGEAIYNGSMEAFGQDRADNLFEIAAAATRQELSDILAPIAGIRVEAAGDRMLLRTSPDVTSAQVLHLITGAGVEVGFFRNISASTVRLFNSTE